MNIGGLPVWLGYSFLIIGGITSALAIAALCMNVSESIKSLIENYKYRYKYKHRFDKSPLAKCRCIDCENWNKPTEKCWVFGCHTADWWFCQSAQPRERDPDSQ